MSTSDLEKSAGIADLPQQPQPTQTHPRSDFLPSYEEHLNAELLDFPQPVPQINLQPFDDIQEPATKKKNETRRHRTCWSAVFCLLFLIITGITGSAVFLYRNARTLKDEANKTTSQQTSIPARSATTVTITPTTVITVPAAINTVIVTIPAPTTTATMSTSTRIVTVTPSTSTTDPVVSFTTQSSATTESSIITFSTETTSSSTQPESSTWTSLPDPSTSVSTTTATATPSTSSTEEAPAPPTIHPLKPGWCGVPGESCA